MARSIRTDPFQNFRFHLVEAPSADGDRQFFDVAAGFVSLNLPEISLEPAEYKTGLDKFKKKYPGPPSVTDVSLSQGIFKTDSPLYDWVLSIINGGVSYRKDLLVYHYHIQDNFTITEQPARVIRLRECWPSNLKPNPDYEANSSEISLIELTLACERFEIERGNQSIVLEGGTSV